jgi:integrase
MSIRFRNGRPLVEVYDPATRRKRHVKPTDHGMAPAPAGASRRALEQWARRLEARALEDLGSARPGRGEETVDSFAARWTRDFPRGESTNLHNAERVKAFAREHAGRPLRSLTARQTRPWALAHRSAIPALRAMFNDAINDGLADENPFARLGLQRTRGREDITVLTADEVDELARTAIEVHGDGFGDEMAAMIIWAAYTCCRPGETFAARYSLLDGDIYQLHTQFNSRLGRETRPKHDGAGAIYVPEPARRAVHDKPRRIGDDLIFRTKRGKQFRQETLHRAWVPIREVFTARLPVSHHLRTRLAADKIRKMNFHELRHFGAAHMLNELGLEPWVIAKQLRHDDDGALVVKLYGHPTRTTAIDRMRRAFGGNVTNIAARKGDVRGTTARESQ